MFAATVGQGFALISIFDAALEKNEYSEFQKHSNWSDSIDGKLYWIFWFRLY